MQIYEFFENSLIENAQLVLALGLRSGLGLREGTERRKARA